MKNFFSKGGSSGQLPPDAEMVNGRIQYKCGTLRYTKYALITLFIWMLWGNFCYDIMEQLIPTLMPVLLKQHHASNLTIGLLVGSIPSLIGFILIPIVGVASDRTRTGMGRRIPYLLFSSPLVVLFLIMVGWSSHLGRWLNSWLGTGSVEQTIIVLIAIFGVGFQLFNIFVSSVFYYIFADVVPKSLVGRFMAYFRVVGTFAGVIYQRYIIPLADVEEYIPWIFTGVALIYLISFTLMCFRVKEGEYPPPEKNRGNPVFGNIRQYVRECFSMPFYMLLFIALAINTTSNICRSMFNLLYAKEYLGLTLAEYGGIMSVMSIIMVFGYIPLGWVVDKFHPLRVFIIGGILIIFSNILGFFWCRDYVSFYIVTFIISITYALQKASNLPLTVRLFPSEKYGQFCSANGMVSSVVLITANAGGGIFIDRFGYQFIFIWDVIFTVIAVAMLLIVYCKWKKYGGDRDYVPPMKSDRQGV